MKISESNFEEIKKFDDVVWDQYDLKHYGKMVEFYECNFIFKAEEDKEILGVGYGKYECGVSWIDGLIIDKKYLGKGIGSKLLNEIEKWSKKTGGHKVILYTGEKWDSRNFYEKNGYKKVADLPDFYFHTDFVMYSKNI